MKKNLLSVTQLAKKNLVTIFYTSGHCFVLDMKKDGAVIAEGIESDNLYKLLSTPIVPTYDVKSFAVSSKDNNEIWHLKYGHISNDRLELLKNSNIVTRLSKMSFKPLICKSCMMGKQHWNPFS